MALTVFFRSSNTAIIEWLSSLGSVYPCTGLAAFEKNIALLIKSPFRVVNSPYSATRLPMVAKAVLSP